MELEPEIIRPGGNSYFPENPNDEPDLPPEYCHYLDEGCEFADSCLNCPFPRCIYDEPGGKQRFIKDLRNKEMLRLYTDGKEIKELAEYLIAETASQDPKVGGPIRMAEITPRDGYRDLTDDEVLAIHQANEELNERLRHFFLRGGE